MQQVSNLPLPKAESVAFTEVEDRVSAKKLAKHTSPGTNRVMLMAPSKKLPGGNLLAEPTLGVYGQGEAMFVLLTTEQIAPPRGAELQSAPVVILVTTEQ